MPLTVRGNTILNNFDQTDAIGLFQDFGVEENRLIEGNLLAGGGYTLYAGQNPDGAPTRNIVIKNNRFSRVYFPNSGKFGYGAAYLTGGEGNRWMQNYWDEDLMDIAAP